MSRTNPDFQGVPRLHGVDATLSQHAPVEEGVAGAIGEFNEAEAFLGTEPLHDSTDRWTRRGLEPGLAESGSGAEYARS